ncbi:hypothetical protein [Rubrivirga sp.]|uniref:hypothetical protein n=1 Tax=Rubrivirga sp. TaxID=1885344 RepID=UPI003C7075A9
MRLIVLFALLAPLAHAQTDSEPRADPSTDPEALVRMLGREWADLEAVTPAPDSGAVARGAGSVWWPSGRGAWVRVDVQHGVVVQVTSPVNASFPSQGLARFVQELEAEVGPAGPDGYFDTAGWGDFREEIGLEYPPGLKVQYGIFAEERLMVVRLTPGSYP